MLLLILAICLRTTRDNAKMLVAITILTQSIILEFYR